MVEDIDNSILTEELEEGDNTTSPVHCRPTSGFVGVSTKHKLAMEKIETAWDDILSALSLAYGLNTQDENFRETPKRIAKMMILERCSGINSEKDCVELLGKKFPAMVESNEEDQIIVTSSPAIVYSICPHHFENVRYRVWSGYIPRNEFRGISKFSRMIELYAKQPILQESYTSGLVNIIMEALDPKGAIVVVKGSHDCMIARGAKSNPEQFMITSAMRGIFAQDGMETYKEEFFTLCRNTGL